MKKLTYLFLSLSLFLIAACQDDEATVTPEPIIREIMINSSGTVNTVQHIELTLAKPTPCHEVREVIANTSGNEVNYNIVLESSGQICAQVIEEETITLEFNPQTRGTYTLNFLINGKLHETRQVVVN